MKITGRKTNSTPSFIESDGLFITNPFDANYFIYYFIDKVGLSACCQLLANCWGKLCLTKYNAISQKTDFQHAYREGHLLCTALTLD